MAPQRRRQRLSPSWLDADFPWAGITDSPESVFEEEPEWKKHLRQAGAFKILDFLIPDTPRDALKEAGFGVVGGGLLQGAGKVWRRGQRAWRNMPEGPTDPGKRAFGRRLGGPDAVKSERELQAIAGNRRDTATGVIQGGTGTLMGDTMEDAFALDEYLEVSDSEPMRSPGEWSANPWIRGGQLEERAETLERMADRRAEVTGGQGLLSIPKAVGQYGTREISEAVQAEVNGIVKKIAQGIELTDQERRTLKSVQEMIQSGQDIEQTLGAVGGFLKRILTGQK